MTSTPRIVRAAARALSKEPDPATSPDAAREETIAAIKGALRERAAARRRRRWVFPAVGLAAAAAVAALVTAGALRASHPVAATSAPVAPAASPPSMKVERVEGAVAAVDLTSQAKSALTEGASVRIGDQIVASEGSATITLPSGTRLDVERESGLRVDIAGGIQTVALTSGIVTSRVAKVHPGERFLVRAGDVEVEVRGTIFRVERRTHARCGAIVKVDVLEGRVAVRGPNVDRTLSAGEGWATTCPDETANAAPQPAASTSGGPGSRTPKTPASSDRVAVSRPAPADEPPAPASASELAAQNALFGEAMAAKSRGDSAGAIAKLDTFLQRYPVSPLHEAAMAQRLRLLAGSDRTNARAAAKDYIARYPNGFARKDADAVLTSD